MITKVISLGDAVRANGDGVNRCVVCEPTDLFANMFYIMVKLFLDSDNSSVSCLKGMWLYCFN